MFRITCAILALAALPAFADPAVVQDVKVVKSGANYTFSVTVRHNDIGWDDYVNIWRIKDMSGNVLGERVLVHPRVNEQPFTRSLSGVKIPDSVDTVLIEAHDTVTGWSGAAKTVKLR